MSRAVDDLLAVLDVEQLENNLFRGRSPQVGWVPLLVQQLIPEEEHLVFQEGPVQLFELAIAQRLAEVDALNLGANAGRNGCDGDGIVGHGLCLSFILEVDLSLVRQVAAGCPADVREKCRAALPRYGFSSS